MASSKYDTWLYKRMPENFSGIYHWYHKNWHQRCIKRVRKKKRKRIWIWRQILSPGLDFFPQQRERSDSSASLQQWLTADDRRNQYSNMKSMSMESAHSSSSRGSDADRQQRGFGGSYSAATGCSSKVISNTLNISAGQPKLAQVAIALMKAKVAGELPSALGDKAVIERQLSQAAAGGPGPPPAGQPDIAASATNLQLNRSVVKRLNPRETSNNVWNWISGWADILQRRRWQANKTNEFSDQREPVKNIKPGSTSFSALPTSDCLTSESLMPYNLLVTSAWNISEVKIN